MLTCVRSVLAKFIWEELPEGGEGEPRARAAQGDSRGDSRALGAPPGAVAGGAAGPEWWWGARWALRRPHWLPAGLRAALPGGLGFRAGALRAIAEGEAARTPPAHLLLGKCGRGAHLSRHLAETVHLPPQEPELWLMVQTPGQSRGSWAHTLLGVSHPGCSSHRLAGGRQRTCLVTSPLCTC